MKEAAIKLSSSLEDFKVINSIQSRIKFSDIVFLSSSLFNFFFNLLIFSDKLNNEGNIL